MNSADKANHRHFVSDKYNPSIVEKKWQERWEKEGIYKAPEPTKAKKMYILDMFPYPSAASMHVGHLEGYVGTDILSRYSRMQGYQVLHPMGWDAFGLPAENYAIKTGINPNKLIHENIKTFKRQLDACGLSYDWDKEIDTSSPEFYKWTQWLFIRLFKKGLAYKKKSPVNWCPKDETVLANEQVIDGKCERCDTPVIQKELDQWFFKITAYADRLISGLERIDWPEEVKRQQINWIGRSEGMVLDFKVVGGKEVLKVFTTRPDTLESVTFIAAAESMAVSSNEKSATRDDKKVGKFTGKYVVNPFTGNKIQIWETNYVASDYGTGAIMGVPAYDERDMEFVRKYKIDIVEKPFNSSIEKLAIEGKWGKKEVNYHLRDWLISRQRYWGCPIPMVYCESCASKDISFKGQAFKGMAGWFPVDEKELPVLLPEDVDFLPHGESPIARSKTFQKGVKCPKCGKPATREVDTMDTYVDSSWYFIRFVDPKNNREIASNEAIKAWLPVDHYVGGGHVVQHLLFARFFWKFLFDEGLIDKLLGDEPFLKLRAPGCILGEDSRKMSKRWGNVVTPDDIFLKFGADTLRVYEMFMGPFDVMKPWSMAGVEGAHRFLGRVWRLFNNESGITNQESGNEVNIKMHQTIKKVTEDIEEMKFNTAISSIMELVNVMTEYKVHRDSITSWAEYLETLAQLLAPFAPHMMEEIWVEKLEKPFLVHTSEWPKYDAKYLKVDQVTIVIQINGKMRGSLNLESGMRNQESEITKMAKSELNIAKWLEGKNIVKTIFIPGKVLNFVIE